MITPASTIMPGTPTPDVASDAERLLRRGFIGGALRMLQRHGASYAYRIDFFMERGYTREQACLEVIFYHMSRVF